MGKNRKIIALLATFFYLGKSPWIPGTVGTLGGLPVVLLLSGFSPAVYMVLALILCALAIAIAQAHENNLGVHDSREIVIDEVVGYVIAMTWLPFTWQALMAAFLLFRLLDGLKPFPIDFLDRKVQGGLGVVVDDVAAGLITNFILQIVYFRTDWLGVQLPV